MKTREELEKMTKPEVKEYAKSLKVPNYTAKIENSNGKKSEPPKEILIDRILAFCATEPVLTEPAKTEPAPTEPVKTEPVARIEGMNIMKVYEFLGFNQDEINAVVEASKISGMSQESIIKSGILTRAKKVSSEFEKTKNLSTEELKQSTFIGAGHKIIKETIDKLVISNNAAYDNKTRVFINPSVVRSLTGCNLNSIKQVFDNYFTDDKNLETIDEHNQRYGLTNRDNKKGRDELGNRIKISDLIASVRLSEPKEETIKPLHFESDIIPSYQQFAAYIDNLENEESIINASQELAAKLREYYKKLNPNYENTLHSEFTKYRKEINNLRLKPFATFTHEYGTPRTLKDGEPEPKGCTKNEEGKIINEPRHIALKYLVLTKIEQDKRNNK
jgi:hypothetical protein